MRDLVVIWVLKSSDEGEGGKRGGQKEGMGSGKNGRKMKGEKKQALYGVVLLKEDDA